MVGLGVSKECHKSHIINVILTHVRSYVHRQKLFFGGQLEMTQWLREFRTKLKVEEWVSSRTGKSERFRIWTPVLRALG